MFSLSVYYSISELLIQGTLRGKNVRLNYQKLWCNTPHWSRIQHHPDDAHCHFYLVLSNVD